MRLTPSHSAVALPLPPSRTAPSPPPHPALPAACRLLLKFPEIHRGFSKARAVFLAAGLDAQGMLPVERLPEVVASLGYHPDEETAAALAKIEGAEQDSMDAEGFLVAVAICHILKVAGLVLGCVAGTERKHKKQRKNWIISFGPCSARAGWQGGGQLLRPGALGAAAGAGRRAAP